MSNAKMKPIETEAETEGEIEQPAPATPNVPALADELADAVGRWAKAESAKFAEYATFKKGHFYKGADKIEIALGTAFAADPVNLCAGWIMFDGGQVADQLLGPVNTSENPSRSSMGHTDTSKWQKDGDGVPQDPFKEQRTLPLRNLDTGEQLTLSVSSFYGNRAILNFIFHWQAKRKENPGKLPILKLGAAKRPTTHWGDVDVPVFSLVDWLTPAEVDGTGGPTQEQLDDDIPF